MDARVGRNNKLNYLPPGNFDDRLRIEKGKQSVTLSRSIVTSNGFGALESCNAPSGMRSSWGTA
jgi:hypothetical protein